MNQKCIIAFLSSLLIVAAFSFGMRTAYAQEMDATSTALMQCNNVLSQYADDNRALVETKRVIVPYTFRDCVRSVSSFYIKYPTYTVQSEDLSLTITMPIVNPQEDAWQLCDFLINELPANKLHQ